MISANLEVDHKDLFAIDQNINRLVGRIELLNYVNPLNIAQERKKFYKEKYDYTPVFRYRKPNFNAYKLHRLLYSQRINLIKDDLLRQLYQDIIYTYSGLLQCIETIGSGDRKFYYNSLRFFGTPTQRMVDNARYILHFESDQILLEDRQPTLTTADAIEFFENYQKQYAFTFDIKTSTSMSAAAMVSNRDKTLILKKNHLFSRHQLQVLAHHEIGVHLVTTFNAVEQPLKIFSNGFPNNEETQEGLAVMAEFLSGNLTIDRLKELAYRVIAVDSLIKGFDFPATFDLLYNQYKLDRDSAFNITLRVHRGGGWTKDALYLSGLINVYREHTAGAELQKLLYGKCALEYSSHVHKIKDMGLLHPQSHVSKSLQDNLNSNDTVSFILKNLK